MLFGYYMYLSSSEFTFHELSQICIAFHMEGYTNLAELMKGKFAGGEVHIISEKHKDPQTIKIESSRLKYGTPDAELIITDHMEGYTNLAELMKGKFAGVEVVLKGGKYYIYVRGLSTINGDPNPLLLIDGNPISFD